MKQTGLTTATKRVLGVGVAVEVEGQTGGPRLFSTHAHMLIYKASTAVCSHRLERNMHDSTGSKSKLQSTFCSVSVLFRHGALPAKTSTLPHCKHT